MRMRLLALSCLLSLTGFGCDGLTPSDFSLQVDTPAPVVQRGASTDILIQLVRTGPARPVHVVLQNLPVGVSVEPIQVPADQQSGLLHVRASEEAVVGDYTVDIVATGSGRTDTDSIRLQVADIPANAPIVVASEEANPVLDKGRTSEVAFLVDRSGGFTGSFLVEPGAPLSPWISFEPVLVPFDATRFILKVAVDERRVVGPMSLALKLGSGPRSGVGALTGEIIGPPEAPPQLTSMEPTALAFGQTHRVTLKGTGLSNTRAVSVASAGVLSITLISATSSEVQADLKMSFTGWTGVFPNQLLVQTPTGQVAWPFTASNLHVDSVTGSDTTGTGAVALPFASIHRAIGACSPCVDSPSGYPGCQACPITLAPGIHRPGSVGMSRNIVLVGTGDLYGSNPSTIEATGEANFFRMNGNKVRNVKLSGYKQGLEAFKSFYLGAELTRYPVYPAIEDVWLTGGDYGISVCEGLTVRTVNAPVRISHNRVAGIRCNQPIWLTGSATWPVEITHNGEGSPESGGAVHPTGLSLEYAVVSHNQGPGVKAVHVTARNSIFEGNAGPGVWASMSGANLGTVASPGGNTLQDNAINLRVDGNSSVAVSAVGNCWNPPAGEDYADTTADGACGRIRKPFALGDTTYIDAEGKTQAPFTWTGPARFNYFLSSTSATPPSIQF
jgi:hypothetical protein